MSIINILLSIILFLQILVLIQLLYTNHKNYIQNKEFNEELRKKSLWLYDSLDMSENTEEEIKNEQRENENL